MQPDFEPVIERKFHNYINCIEGVYHTGQRDMQRIRISIDAFNAGFRIKHIGEVLYASVKNEFDAVVDKCEVVIYTDPAECTRIRHEVAIPIFDKRDERLDTLTDESVDVYYSCIPVSYTHLGSLSLYVVGQLIYTKPQEGHFSVVIQKNSLSQNNSSLFVLFPMLLPL